MRNKPLYLALGCCPATARHSGTVDREDRGAKFWMMDFNDVLIAVTDGLKGMSR